MPDAMPAAVGRYQMLRELGRGMMGVVYEAHDPILGRNIALKMIQAVPAATDEERALFEQRFFAEARAAARLTHPGIVVVHDIGRDDASGAVFMALELLRGRPLSDRLRAEGAFEWRTALELARQVAEALHHAHSHGVVHRDVKPANIMLLESGAPKIMDFGIAKLETSQLTASGQLFGTPLYMSPEQALAQPVDARSDVFSLGAVLYEMLTGRQAFAGENITKILFQIISSEPAAPTTLARGLPPDLDGVLARSLAKDRALRYPDAQALAHDVEDVLAGRPPRGRGASSRPPAGSGTLATPSATASVAPAVRRVPQPAATPALPARVGRRKPRRGMVIVLAALAVIALAYVVLRPGPVARRIDPSSASDGRASATPTAGKGATDASPPDADASKERAAAKARLDVEFEHSLRSGVLRVWVDEDEVIHEEFGGHVTREIAGLKLRKGHVSGALEVEPGRRAVKVQVEWADGIKADSVSGNFKPGVSYRLIAKLGGLGGLLKDLSLELY